MAHLAEVHRSPIVLSDTQIPEIATAKEEYKTPEEFQKLFASFLATQEFPNIHEMGYSPEQKQALFLNDLIQSGNLGLVYTFCNTVSEEELTKIVNATPYGMHFGNVLHSTLYAMRGQKAIDLYKYFRSVGAKQCLNYYNQLPFEQMGNLWTMFPSIAYTRNPSDFSETYETIRAMEKSAAEQTVSHKKTFTKVPCHCFFHYDDEYSETERDSEEDGSD